MPETAMEHPDPELLKAYGLGHLDPDAMEALEVHLESSFA
jgi:hypothetical protein